MAHFVYRNLSSLVDACVRHYPERFDEASRTVTAADSVQARSGAARSKPPSARSRIESAVVAMRSELARHPVGSLSVADARHTVLLAWLLSPDTALCKNEPELRPLGLEDLPYLDAGAAAHLAVKYRLHTDSRWIERLRSALRLLGVRDDVAVRSDSTRDATIQPTDGPPRTGTDDYEIVIRPCDRRALRAYRWAEEQRPDLVDKDIRATPLLWHVVIEKKCPYYAGGRIPNEINGTRYVRRALRDIQGAKYSRRAGRDHGRSIARPDEIE